MAAALNTPRQCKPARITGAVILAAILIAASCAPPAAPIIPPPAATRPPTPPGAQAGAPLNAATQERPVQEPTSSIAAQAPALPHPTESTTEQVPTAIPADVSPPAADEREAAIPHLDATLAQIYAAHRAGDQARLAALAGGPHIDLAAGTARVILEMDRDPEAHQSGPPVVEEITGADGQVTRIEYAPPIAVREDLAQAIAATGATYETAYENWVQVLAPFGSLPALAQIPAVRLVRLPFAAGW